MKFSQLLNNKINCFSHPAIFIINAFTALGLTSSLSYASPILPDAGTVLQEVPKVQPQLDKKVDQAFFNPTNDNKLYSDDPMPIFVRQVEIQGNTVFNQHTLHQLVAKLENKNNTLADLQRATQQITEYYRQHGYFLARAYLPKQQLTDGILNLQILEGKLGQVSINNQSKVHDQVLQRYLKHIPLNQPLKEEIANRTLLLISDLTGIDATQASLQAGQQTGQTDLNIDVLSDKPWQGHIGLDNYGSSYTGEYRLSSYIEENSLLGYGEKLTAQFLASNHGLTSGGISAQLPLTGQGLMLGASISRTEYELGEQFTILDAKGKSDNYNLNLSYPFIRSQDINLNIRTALEYRKLWDEIAVTDTQTDKHSKVSRVQLSYSQRDQFGFATVKGGLSQMELTVSLGKLDIQSPSALNIDRLSAKTNGSFQKYELSLSRQQALAPRLTATAQLYGQIASKNLDSSEKFSFSQMRAYPSAEGLGDQGWGASLNIYYQILPALNVYVFKDLGQSYQNKNQYLPDKNERYLASTGLGLGGGYKQLDYNASLAWRDTNAARSDEDKKPRILVQAGWRF